MWYVLRTECQIYLYTRHGLRKPNIAIGLVVLKINYDNNSRDVQSIKHLLFQLELWILTNVPEERIAKRNQYQSLTVLT